MIGISDRESSYGTNHVNRKYFLPYILPIFVQQVILLSFPTRTVIFMCNATKINMTINMNIYLSIKS